MAEVRNLDVILADLDQTARRLALAAEGFSPEELIYKPGGNEFSFTEQVWHLRDLEEIGYGNRIDRILSEDRPMFQDINGLKLAMERGYNNFPFASGLAEFEQLRDANIKRVRSLGPVELQRVGYFEGGPDLVLTDILGAMHEHDLEHLEQVATLRQTLLNAQTPA